jgi:hypothetical protein
MAPIDTVEFVRQRRRGALNSVQLAFLMDSYKRQWSKKHKMTFLAKRSGSPTLNGAPMAPTASQESASSASSVGHALKESLTKVFRFTKKQSSIPE